MKIKRWLSVMLCTLLCVGMLPTMAFAAGKISVSTSAKGAASWDMVLTVDGETRSPFKVKVGETVHAEITVKPSANKDLAYVIVGNDYSPTQGSENDVSELVGLKQLSCAVSPEGEYKMEYEFTVPEGVTMLCVRAVCDVPSEPEPEPEPEIKISTKALDSVEYDSGAVEFLGVVTDKNTGKEIIEGEVQYYLNGKELFTAVRYDSAREEKGFYRSVSTDEVFDETALQMGENTIYAKYSDDKGNTATSNEIEINVVKKDICKEQSPISMGYSKGAVYDGTPGYGRAQLSVMANDDYWQRREFSMENLSFTAEKDGVAYTLTPSDYKKSGNTLIVFAAPYPGTYTFTAQVNHKYYTGQKSVTVTVGKRDIVISPADAFTNRNTEPEFEVEIGGKGLAEADELKNVQYKIEDSADLGTPGEYSVEIVSYELDNKEYYNITLESGILTVLEDADYTVVKAAKAKAEALDKEEYKDFSAVEAAINAVIWDKNITEQAEVNAMAKAIEDAIAALEYKPADYSKVDEAVKRAEALNKEDYKDFSKVEAAVKAVVYGKNITEQAEVNAMAKAIEDAIGGLEKKPAESENPSVPQTGDSSHPLMWIMLVFLSGGAVLTLIVKGRKRTEQ